MTDRLLIIVACSDQTMWYSQLIGKTVPMVLNLPLEMCWLAKEPDGLVNVVKHTDAVLMPAGYKQVLETELLQHGDMVFSAGNNTPWRTVKPEEMGMLAIDCLAIRKSNEG